MEGQIEPSDQAVLVTNDAPDALDAYDGERAAEVAALYRHLQRAFEYLVERRPAWACSRGTIQQYDDYIEEVYSSEHPEAVKEMPPEQTEWLDLDALSRTGLEAMLVKWDDMRAAAVEELRSGFTSAGPVFAAERQSPWALAQFLAQRERLMRDWLPRNGIEATLIDMLAQSYCAYTHWLSILTFRTTWDARELTEEQARWELPRQSEADAIEQARAMADSFHRMFMRTLRGLREMRRMSPVVVQNAAQVNVGAQQVNVAAADPPDGKRVTPTRRKR